MRKTLLPATARALAALLALAGLLVGVPIALAMLGWPLPTSIPTPAQLREALSGATISDAVLVKGLTVVCWLAWAQLAVSVMVELRAWAQGRAATALPMAGMLQPVARRLVLSAVLVMGSARTATPTVVSLQSVVTASAVVAPPADPAPEPEPALGQAPDKAATLTAPLTCVVQPRDSLWSLAETHLGDGYRWRELHDLNRGVAQPDGGTLSDPDLIRPGWTLVFPADAHGLSPGALPEEPVPAPQPPPPQPAEQPAPAAAEPAAPATEPTTASGPAQSDGSAATTTSTARLAPRTAPKPGGGAVDEPGIPAFVGLTGAGLVAGGVVVTLDRLRRVQQRRRRPGTTIPMPDTNAADVERRLRVAASAAPTDRLDVALRALSACLASRTTPADVSIEAVSADKRSVEILLASPLDVPSGPFDVTAGGRSWTLPAGAADAADLASRRPAPVPALVSIGRIGERELLVDLEAHRRTALVGDGSEVRNLLAAMVLELATNRWADDLRVVLVGPDGHDVPPLERLQVVRTIGEALPEIDGESSALTAALRDAGYPSTLAARLADVADGWVPTIVLVSAPSDPDLAALLALAETNQGLAVVMAGDPGVPVDRSITLGAGTVRLSPPALEIAPLGLPEAEIEALNTVLAVAASHEDGEKIVLTADVDQSAWQDASSPVALMTTRTRQAEVEVRVLGAPEVHGGKQPIDRKKSKELVVYLALHPDGIDESQLKAALWPGQVPTSGSFNQTVSKARLSLGRTEDGVHHLPHVTDGRYRLAPTVASDLRRLETAFSRAIVSSADEVMDELAAALAAVRGVPFAGATGYEWAHADGHAARIESITADAALLMSEWCYDRRDTAKALWAAGQGLLASPGDERLFRMRMRAHDLAGNPAGVESAMEELCSVVESLEPHDDLHPETVALYEELSRRRRRTG